VPASLKGKDLLTLAELSPADLNQILDLSASLKRRRSASLGSKSLKGRSIALVFEKPSTRTRVSFQVAIGELGGTPVSLSSSELQLGRGETLEDTARVLSRYVHAIMARVIRHGDVERLGLASSVPVVNGLSDLHHPLQVLADLLTLRERKGKIKGLKVAWIGDGNNVCNSWAYGAALAGIRFTAATPERYEPDSATVSAARTLSRSTGGGVEVVRDPEEAVRNADCVITDTFLSMGVENEREERERVFIPTYRVDRHLMSLAKKKAIFEHCLPAHRGEEVTAEVIDGPQSAVFDEAENRLHTSKALLCFLLLRKKDLSSLIKGR